ncbi:hypothetical protein FOZ61_004527, partial [Perkinsus olseni]
LSREAEMSHRGELSIPAEQFHGIVRGLVRYDGDSGLRSEDIELAKTVAAARLTEESDPASTGRIVWSKFLDYVIAADEVLHMQASRSSLAHEFRPSQLNHAASA